MSHIRTPIAFLLVIFLCITGYSQTDSITRKAGASVQRATKYLTKAMPLKSHNNLLLLEYLQRVYSLKLTGNIQQQLQAPPQFDDEKQQMRFLKRLYGQKCDCTRQDFGQLTGIFRLMALSINTDVMKPNEKLSELMWAMSETEDRNLTHAALSLAWLREQGKDGLLKDVDSLYKLQTVKLKLLAEKEDYASDTGLEALVGLIRLGKASLIKPEWIAKIMAAQNTDGGWAWLATDDSASNEHSTILALWVLTDYLQKGHVNGKWVN